MQFGENNNLFREEIAANHTDFDDEIDIVDPSSPSFPGLKGSAQALIELAEAGVEFGSIEDPYPLILRRSIVTGGQLLIPESDCIFLIEDGATELFGNDTYFLNRNGEKLDVPSIPDAASQEYPAWRQGYLAWLHGKGFNESNSMLTRQESQVAYNLSRLQDLGAKTPLVQVTNLYVMEQNRKEQTRGDKQQIFDSLFTFQRIHGSKLEVRVWSITIMRIKQAEYLETNTSAG